MHFQDLKNETVHLIPSAEVLRNIGGEGMTMGMGSDRSIPPKE